MQVVTDWFRRHFSNPEVVFLALLLAVLFAVVVLWGDMLAPVLTAIVIAYLLEGVVRVFERVRLPRVVAVLIVFMLFLLFVNLIVFGLLPLLSKQATQLFQQIPSMIGQGQSVLMQLPERYPEIISPEQIQQVIAAIRSEITGIGQTVLSYSVASVVGVIQFVIYMILLPILVFFLLKDKNKIIAWIESYLPREHKLAKRVWHDVDRQIGNYIRGKFWEVMIVGTVSHITFAFFGLQYAMLLGVLVGVSVLVPFIGAAVVTIPVVLIAWFQWGWGDQFWWLFGAYLTIQILDGNVLVPLMFSEVVDLHPVAIIVAVLFFGGIWGLWGIFFAIPLATLVQAVLTAWPGGRRPGGGATSEEAHG